MLKKVVEYSSLFALLGFLLHYTYLWSYYSYFSINILLYVDFTEILISLTTWLIIPLLICGIGLILIIPNLEIREKKIHLNFLKRNKRLELFVFLLISISFFISHFYSRFQNGDYTANLISNYARFIFITITSCLTILILYKGFFNRTLTSFLPFGALISFIIIPNLISLGNYQAVALIRSKSSGRNYTFLYHNSIIKTDSSIRFIGQTKSALFLYNNSNNTTSIYKSENIDSLVISP